MAYTPINWQTGDTITAEKLNRCDNGWSVTSGTTTLCDETITAVDDGGMYCAQLSVTSITASTITVTYYGTPYQCVKDGDGGYGTDVNFTFADYPFRIEGNGFIITETVGSHTVKIEAVESDVDTSAAFDAAVTAASPLYRIAINSTTWQEAHDAMAAGKIAYCFSYNGDSAFTCFAEGAYFDDSDNRYHVSCNGGNMTLSAGSSSGALFADKGARP